MSHMHTPSCGLLLLPTPTLSVIVVQQISFVQVGLERDGSGYCSVLLASINVASAAVSILVMYLARGNRIFKSVTVTVTVTGYLF